MPFQEHREALAADLGRLQELVRQAQEVSRALEDRAANAAGETETFADDTALAKVTATVKRARQDLGALNRLLRETREGLGTSN